MKVGMRLYYSKLNGEILVNTGDRIAMDDYQVPSADDDFTAFSKLSERNRETVDFIDFEYGAYTSDYTEGGVICRIDLETLEPLFTYPDPNDPETLQEPRPALSKQVDQLAAESNANQLALMELHMMLLGAMPDAE